MTVIEQFMGRDAGPLVQFIKYGIAGGCATAAHIVIFHLAAWKILPALQAKDAAVVFFKLSYRELDDATRARNSMLDNGIAFVISNFIAYLLNIFWVFHAGKYPWYIEIGLFYLVSGISIAIGTGIMGYLIKRHSIRTTYAFLANLVTALLINFAMRKFVIFKG